MVWLILNPFVRTGEVLRIIGIVGTFNYVCRPSELMSIKDEYTAFCFDEACAFIIRQIKDGKEPIMRIENDSVVYKKPSDLYRHYNN